MNGCTGLIPVFNEGERLVGTLKFLVKLSPVTEWVIIDDGSTDGGVAQARNLFKDIGVITLGKNYGKTYAVAVGLEQVRTNHVLLMDADLREIDILGYESGLKIMLSRPEIDMLIFRRIRDVSRVYSGERVMKTAVLREIFTQYPQMTGFQLEAACNQYCIDFKKSAYWWPVLSINTYQIQKVGFVRGWRNNFATIIEIIKLVGWKNYLEQLKVIQRWRTDF